MPEFLAQWLIHWLPLLYKVWEFHVVDLGLSTTPTVEVMVPELNADGGIILTASHNPKQWNALKLNEKENLSVEKMVQKC